MRSFTLLVTLVLAISAAVLAQSNMPMLRSVDKPEALRGDVVVAGGEKLGKTVVAELFLTAGSDDVKVKILEQTDTSIKFEVGANTKFARYGLMVLTAGDSPTYIEQPVKLSVVEKLSPKQEAPPEAPSEAAPSEASPSPQR